MSYRINDIVEDLQGHTISISTTEKKVIGKGVKYKIEQPNPYAGELFDGWANLRSKKHGRIHANLFEPWTAARFKVVQQGTGDELTFDWRIKANEKLVKQGVKVFNQAPPRKRTGDWRDKAAARLAEIIKAEK